MRIRHNGFCKIFKINYQLIDPKPSNLANSSPNTVKFKGGKFKMVILEANYYKLIAFLCTLGSINGIYDYSKAFAKIYISNIFYHTHLIYIHPASVRCLVYITMFSFFFNNNSHCLASKWKSESFWSFHQRFYLKIQKQSHNNIFEKESKVVISKWLKV